jgi:hypothetical protein
MAVDTVNRPYGADGCSAAASTIKLPLPSIPRAVDRFADPAVWGVDYVLDHPAVPLTGDSLRGLPEGYHLPTS